MPKTGTNASKAAFLIDGHHVFLETISQIKSFCELMSDGSIAEATLFNSLSRSLNFSDDSTMRHFLDVARSDDKRFDFVEIDWKDCSHNYSSRSASGS